MTVPAALAGDPDYRRPGLPRARGPGAGADRRRSRSAPTARLIIPVDARPRASTTSGSRSSGPAASRSRRRSSATSSTRPSRGSSLDLAQGRRDRQPQDRHPRRAGPRRARRSRPGTGRPASRSAARPAADGTFSLSLPVDRRARTTSRSPPPTRPATPGASSSPSGAGPASCARRSARRPTAIGAKNLPDDDPADGAPSTTRTASRSRARDVTFTLSMPGDPDRDRRRRRPTRTAGRLRDDASQQGRRRRWRATRRSSCGPSEFGADDRRDRRSRSTQVAVRHATARARQARTIAATIRAMPMWRCPHCGTPQAETARCWVCRRSSTACGDVSALPTRRSRRSSATAGSTATQRR